MADDPFLQQPTPAAKHPTATADLKYTDTHRPGLDQTRALVRHFAGEKKHKPEERADLAKRVAELIAQYSAERDQIMHFLHETKQLGNNFAQLVARGGTDAKHAQQVNTDLTGTNPDSGDQSKNKIPHTNMPAPDPNRLEVPGTPTVAKHTAKIATTTPIYRNDGSAYTSHAPEGDECKLNAGGAKTITIDGTPTPCVLAFYVGPPNPDALPAHDRHVTGWVPVSALNADGQMLAGVDKTIAAAIDKKHAGFKFSSHARKVKPVAAPAEYKNLRTAAHQPVDGTANHCDHYFARPGNVVNLYDNIVNSGGTRFGVSLDVMTEQTEFFAATPTLEDHTQLFKAGTYELTNQVITFVYGKAQAPGQAASYGWVNKACLA